jgi:hypothetical protein
MQCNEQDIATFIMTLPEIIERTVIINGLRRDGNFYRYCDYCNSAIWNYKKIKYWYCLTCHFDICKQCVIDSVCTNHELYERTLNESCPDQFIPFESWVPVFKDNIGNYILHCIDSQNTNFGRFSALVIDDNRYGIYTLIDKKDSIVYHLTNMNIKEWIQERGFATDFPPE